MNQMDDTAEPMSLNRTRLVAATLTAMGAILALVSLGWALARFFELGGNKEAGAADFLSAAAWLTAGLAGGVVLWGVAELLRTLDGMIEVVPDDAPLASSGSGLVQDAAPVAMADMANALDDLVSLTRDVRDVALLSEEQRAQRLEMQGKAALRELETAIPAMLQAHRWVEARRRVQSARIRFPNVDGWSKLEEQIESQRARIEARDVEATSRQINDLVALGAWDRAAVVMRDLLERHPDSKPVHDLSRRLSVQRDKADAEQRARLMAQAQEAVSHRDWNKALGLANDVIRRFPRSEEADALREQMPTLVQNAEIQTRQQMEKQFRELMKSHDYQEALQLARELMARYPNSPQASVLRDQVPRLEELTAVHH